ncbi:tRNA U34 5-methylaminomethyl-2-thiouridine-forming methyltransferase MnmC [Formosa sp. Hel1_31_208]|uniref:tRNA (5-methylaminomethyl-2-thiouridine)(34)-methyltransferase MnmD n=1 Tax=Formosa sp. Hel1_31_208 TaxID=1798225 RepID=UPI00087B5802|nr:tRNA (5-methylaminomethyl-2-thiouridine)(34)-methyltransferase MnmD [Formosa sp. Hel1_31_208]SDS12974.1 tRNA U34 5-methylaminomethyl-2-thiouridine-forming methyltransferase MnmC [Formosa sp. Hel1_31_208]
MRRKIITTADGSKTIQIEDWNEQYHSVHGAIQEANHVYIKHGLLFYYSENKRLPNQPISVLEIGFGTGLNALLTLLTAQNFGHPVHYVGVEAFPVTSEELQELNYPSELHIGSSLFEALHETPWETVNHISEDFQLIKQKKYFKEISEVNTYDVIYFDAFGARVQPELWTKELFQIMYKALRQNGVLTTYAAIGRVRRNLESIGFHVERLQGPPGKRHMLRAVKR